MFPRSFWQLCYSVECDAMTPATDESGPAKHTQHPTLHYGTAQFLHLIQVQAPYFPLKKPSGEAFKTFQILRLHPPDTLSQLVKEAGRPL